MNEALRKAVSRVSRALFDNYPPSAGVHVDLDEIKQALRDQEEEISTHRANHDALVIRLGEVTTRLEAADGLLRECAHFIDYGGAADDELAEKITTQLKAADHV